MRVKVRSSRRRNVIAALTGFALLVPLVVAGALLSLPASYVNERAWQPDAGPVAKVQRAVFRMVRKQQSRWAQPPELLVLDIKFKHVQKLQFDREQALEDNVRDSRKNSWVPAALTTGGEKLKVKLRLKGALSDHWDHPKKWSYLIKVKGDQSYDGMKRFSVQRPLTRGFVFEWLFMRALEDEGLMSLRTKFVDITVNGEPLGLYLLQEQIGKRQVEHLRYREGPIISFDAVTWLERMGLDENVRGVWQSSRVEGTQMGTIAPGSPQEASYLKASSLLEGFHRGELKPAQVFDVQQMATLAALRAFFGSNEWDWRDMKFYLNPLTSKLSPISKEIHHGPTLHIPGWWHGEPGGKDQRPFLEQLYSDPGFADIYAQQLERMSSPEYLDAFLARHQEKLDYNVLLLGSEHPWFAFDRGEMELAQKQIRKMLHPARPVNAHLLERTDAHVDLEVGSVHSFPLEVLGVRAGTKGRWLAPEHPTRLAPKRIADMPLPLRVRFTMPAGAPAIAADAKWLLRVRVAGLERTDDVVVMPLPRYVPGLVQGSELLNAAGTVPDVPYLVADESKHELRCVPGAWEIRAPLVIPSGWTLRCEGAVDWNLLDGAFVLSYSTVHFAGAEGEPLLLRSSDHSGQGLAVLDAPGESTLDWVKAHGLSIAAYRGWTMTGALSFYQSDVRITNTEFVGNVRGDDMLNIFRSRFVLEDSVFAKTQADAFDSDFSQGTVSRVLFTEIGNDGIDTSGSTVTVEDVRVEGAGDKALSFGENSTASVRGARITGANIGVAAKDMSRVQVRDSSIEAGNVGLTVLQKKPEFGPAHIVAEGVKLNGLKTDALVEEGSGVTLNGRIIEPNAKNLRGELYEGK